MATNNRNLKGKRNKHGDFIAEVDTAVLIKEDIPVGPRTKYIKDTDPRYMDEYDSDPTLDADIKDLADRITAWERVETLKNRQASIKEREERMKLLQARDEAALVSGQSIKEREERMKLLDEESASENRQARIKEREERMKLMAEELAETKAREKLLDEEIAESRAQTLASEARTKLMKETANNNRNLTGNRNANGDLIPEDDKPKDLTEAIRNAPLLENNLGNERDNKNILEALAEEFGFIIKGDLDEALAEEFGLEPGDAPDKSSLIQSPEFQEVHGDKYNNLFGMEVTVRKSFPDDLEKDEVEDKPDWNKMPDRQKTTTKGMLKKTDIKPGWKKNEGSNFWNVDSESPYWQTEEGYQEAMKVWGKKPGWIKRGSGDKPYASKSSGR